MRFPAIAFLILTLAGTGCASSVRGEMRVTLASPMVTSTLPATLWIAASETPVPPPAQPALAPVDGVTSTQVNVRAEPSTASEVLGVIPADTRIEITAKDPGGNWWQINYPQGIQGKGWVTAQYIRTEVTPEVPTLGGAQTSLDSTAVAVIQQQLNIRSGPGTGFNSLGTLNPQDVVGLTGKDPNGAWLQISFPAGPEGRGWVNAAFVQAQGVESLPIVTESGVILGTGTPTVIPPTPTATVLPARQDQDAGNRPVASVIFDPAGTQLLIYNGDLSSPQGDSDDWIAFRPYGRFVFISLECEGNEAVELEIMENSILVLTYIKCGDAVKQVAVNADSNYLVHVQAAPSLESLQYTNYILTIKTRP